MNLNDIKHIMVVGAGTMGHSIAQVYAQSGIEVDLVDLNQEMLEHAIKLIKSNLTTLAEVERLSHEEIQSILNRIHPTINLSEAASRADLVVEAVNELTEIKNKVFSELNEYCSEDTIFASNTSGLNIFEIVEVKKPERLVINHWFAPPHIIPLVEIVSGPNTSPEILDLSLKLMKKLGKKPIVLKEFVPAFIVNRIQNVISVQFYEMIAKGWATAEQIDLAIKTSLGIRLPIVGVVQSQDFTGLDLVLDIQKAYRMNRRFPQVEEMVNRGNLGAKTGKGWYDYGGRTEEEILKKRDKMYLKMLEHLEKLNGFEPI